MQDQINKKGMLDSEQRYCLHLVARTVLHIQQTKKFKANVQDY